MWQIDGAAQKQITHKVIASSGCGIWKERGSITPQSRPSVTFVTIYWGTGTLFFLQPLPCMDLCSFFLLKKNKKLNIFSSPYVDIAVKAHSFFSAGWVGTVQQTYQSSTGNQFFLCKTLSFSVCGECLPSVVFWHFVAVFFFFSFLNRGFLELLVVLGRKSSQLVILRELGVFSSVCVFVRVRWRV